MGKGITFRTERPFMIGAVIMFGLIWKLHHDYYLPSTLLMCILYY